MLRRAAGCPMGTARRGAERTGPRSANVWICESRLSHTALFVSVSQSNPARRDAQRRRSGRGPRVSGAASRDPWIPRAADSCPPHRARAHRAVCPASCHPLWGECLTVTID